MNKNWQQFLSTQNAHIENEQVLCYGNALGDTSDTATAEKQASLETHVLCDLSHYGLIRARGPEAESFLQNQFCNDVHDITDSHSQLNAYCTPKGRIVAFFRLLQHAGNYYLRLPQEILEPTLKRLRLFVLMTQVSLDDASDELVRIGFGGPQADKRLQAALGTHNIPQQTNDVLQTDTLSVVRVTQTPVRFEIYGDTDAVQTLWTKLATDARPVGCDSWELLEILAGIPEIVSATQETFVPQMINLQTIDALSFKKGCYPGQEVVARMHYLGKLKRRMYRVRTIDNNHIPIPGDNLYSKNSETSQGVGKIVRAQSHPDGGCKLLAVIEIASAEQPGLHLHDAQGSLLELEELPYEVAAP
jgi:folate-binding protein YgfZ